MELLRLRDGTVAILLLNLLFQSAFWTSALARRRGLDQRRWALIGLVLPVISFFLLWARTRPTPSPAGVPLGAASSPPPPSQPAPPPPDDSAEPIDPSRATAALPSNGWFVARDGVYAGPLSLEEARDRLASFRGGAQVWVAGFKTWTEPKRVPGLLPLPGETAARGAPPSPPPPQVRGATSGRLEPLNMWSTRFDCVVDGRVEAELRSSGFGAAETEVIVDGVAHRIGRDPGFGDFFISRGSERLATAKKRSLWNYDFDLVIAGARCEMRSVGYGGRTFVVRDAQGVEIGRIARVGWWKVRADVVLPRSWTPAERAFVVALVRFMWRRADGGG